MADNLLLKPLLTVDMAGCTQAAMIFDPYGGAGRRLCDD